MSVKRLRLNGTPSPKGSKGHRDPATGRLLPGHQLPGPGNPHSKKTAELREAMLAAVTAGDIRAIIRKVITKAKQGDMIAAKLILDRVFGRPTQSLTFEIDPSMDGFFPDERFL